MINLKDLTINELEDFFQQQGEKKFRAKQVFSWIYRGARSFEEMTDLSKGLRQALSQRAELDSLRILRVQKSGKDGTRKYLLGLADGNTIESVFMKYKYGNSICVSSQAGCRMGCRFCASGMDGLKRNLTPGEIADQILTIERDTGETINHVVVMGTGEPFDNYDNLLKFIRNIHEKEGLNISLRNITVSTCGLVPKIREFAEDMKQVNLAVSLHSADDGTRQSMMPINKSYPVDQLLAACRRYTEETGRRITFEYALVKGKNDTKEQIDLLAGKLKGMLCHVNLIPLNEVRESGLYGSNRKQALEIAAYLEARGIPATVRRELGADIDAACGQLRLGELEKF
ncbi:23S rRNA (adenine(2503)-C(2))-methyltransferase RlmN [Anaerovorax odorimutans]|uniref:Probable dual-specificity RNA methyltransferase RlmN n=1 Tax=Anaerovorax odorimutans TaxID=109327 RepID=A0ABT1RPF4_9FIRM|nr:23S rRNA (adenine(2503)-C(2))-methyltransferase RlmN [Anaerovorax odorimutans]MCQ4637079.1 23S rRNA (adenine(2503)-C(2))-methyltransferase RlmN [Anaerovorax odorimutans]